MTTLHNIADASHFDKHDILGTTVDKVPFFWKTLIVIEPFCVMGLIYSLVDRVGVPFCDFNFVLFAIKVRHKSNKCHSDLHFSLCKIINLKGYYSFGGSFESYDFFFSSTFFLYDLSSRNWRV